jgi:CRISPR/Cas system-associated endonuclease Cas3-HD
MAKIIDNPKSMSLVLTKKTSANKSNDNLGYGTLPTGDEVTSVLSSMG